MFNTVTLIGESQVEQIHFSANIMALFLRKFFAVFSVRKCFVFERNVLYFYVWRAKRDERGRKISHVFRFSNTFTKNSRAKRMSRRVNTESIFIQRPLKFIVLCFSRAMPAGNLHSRITWIPNFLGVLAAFIIFYYFGNVMQHV